TMELKLRKGVKFHDGSTFDAQDVAYSLGRVFSKKHPGSHPGLYATTGRFFYNFDRVEVVDPFTVRISTKRADPLMKILLSARNAGIASKEYLERVGLDGSNIHPIGTGPYKVVSNKPGQQMV
ncbi:MAG: ABC transporter substrate-binding protein, partial [Deltaproteobacteria bacterium]|nr:ABC transporter substrate-binding protein [Deltaproteobacteria bacterium]